MQPLAGSDARVVILLLLICGLAYVVRKTRVPYTVALVAMGLALTFWEPLEFELRSEMVLGLFVPPLVFDGSFRLPMAILKRTLPAVLLLAVPGVVLTALIAGAVASGSGLALPLALLFGAIISATDPVAVVALFHTLGVPERLAVLVDAESLANDGTGIVMYQVMLAVVLSGGIAFGPATVEFLRLTAGGVLIGVAVGLLAGYAMARAHDHLLAATVAFAAAYGAFALGETLRASGVLAVVVAGVVCGNLVRQRMPAPIYSHLSNLWEYVAFLGNSFVFLLLGLQVNPTALLRDWHYVAWGIAAAAVSRVVVVYLTAPIAARMGEPIPRQWLPVLTWGGLRGVVALVLALGLPASLGPAADTLRHMTYGVILFTLLVQATTMQALLSALGLARETYEITPAADESPVALADG